MMLRTFIVAWIALSGLLCVACSKCQPGKEVVVYTSIDQAFAEPVLRRFETETSIRIRALYDTEGVWSSSE